MPKKSTSETKKSTKTKKVGGKKATAAHDDIAQLAYLIWQEKGGSEIENWLEAERRLGAKNKKEG